jgi:hypothetical protein
MTRNLHTRMRRALFTTALSALAVAGFGATAASAYLPGHSSGAAHGQVSALTGPSISSATAGTGTVALSWGAVTAPSSGSVSYYVRRDGGAAAGNCPTAGSPQAVLSCTDGSLGPGKHTYTVTSVWRSWTSRGAEQSVTVTTGVADHLVLATKEATHTAGAADSTFTITAKDSGGNTVSTYTGSKSLTFGGASLAGANHPTVANSSGAAVAFGTAETISFTSGVASASTSKNGAMVLYKAETALVTVTDGTLSNGTGLSLTVVPGSTSAFSLPTPATQTAGTSFNETITALDQFGNTTPSYTGGHTVSSFKGPAESPSGKQATFPTSVTFTAGVGTAAVTLYDAQTTTMTVNFFSGSGSTGSFTVKPASASALGVAASTTQTAGSAFNATLTALDAYGNTQPSYEGTKDVSFSGPATSPDGKAPAYPASASFLAGVGTVSVTLYSAQKTTLGASDGTLSGTSSSITVKATSAATFALSTPAPTAGTAFTETVTAKDTYGNTATSYEGSKAVTFSGPGTSPKGEAPKYPASVTFANGLATPSITLYNAASSTLGAAQSTITGTSASFSVTAASASVFVWGSVATQTAGTAFSATLTADDAYGNLAAYEGTKAIAFTGPETSPGGKAPVFPTSVSFTAGVGTVSNITLYDATPSVAITATLSPVKGNSANFAVNPLAASALSLATPTPQTAGSAFGESITAIDSYGNAATGYEGNKSLSFSGPATSPAGKAPLYPASVSFSGGVATASVTLYNAQASTTLGASDGTLSGTSASFIVNGAGAATFTLSTPAPTAGTAFTETVTAKDAYGNIANYSGSKTILFSGPANSPKGETPKYQSPVTFTSGAGTASITLYNAASTTLTAKESTITGTSAPFTVVAAGAGGFSLGTPATQTAGTPFSLSITATDAYGNAAVYEGTKTITFKGPESSPSEKAPTSTASVTFTGGTGTTSVTLYNADATTSIEASQSGGPKGSSANFAVNPAAAAKLAWTGFSGTAGAAEGLCLFSCTWSGFFKNRTWSSHVSVTDAYGNVVTAVGSGHDVTLTMTETGSTGTLSPKSLTMPTAGTATTSSSVAYTSPNSNTWSSDSFTATATGFTTATATIKK